MKKRLLSLFGVLSIGSISAHTVTVQNRTPYYISFRAKFSSPEICQDRKGAHRIICGGRVTGAIPPGRNRSKNVGRCCLKRIEVKYVSRLIPKTAISANDPSRVKTFYAKGKITSCGISCSSNTFTITKNPDNSMRIVRR